MSDPSPSAPREQGGGATGGAPTRCSRIGRAQVWSPSVGSESWLPLAPPPRPGSVAPSHGGAGADAPVQEPRSQPEAPLWSGMCSDADADDSGIATRSPFSSTSGSAPPPLSMFDDVHPRSAAAPPGASAEALATPLVTSIGPHSLRTSCPLAHWSPYTLDISLLLALMSFQISVCFVSLKYILWELFSRSVFSLSLSLPVLSLVHSLAIISPYSSYCACGHSPWVFVLPGLIILLPVITFLSAATHVSRLPCCSVTLLCSRLAPLANPKHLLTMSHPRFLLALFSNLLSSIYLSSFSCLHPDISSDTTPSPGDSASYTCVCASFEILGEFLHHRMVCWAVPTPFRIPSLANNLRIFLCWTCHLSYLCETGIKSPSPLISDTQSTFRRRNLCLS